MMGFEPMTSSLPRTRSTPELHRPHRAGNEARTRDPDLGRVVLYQLSYSRVKVCVCSVGVGVLGMWGEQDSNLRRHQPADLQSAPVDRFGISPFVRANEGIRTPDLLITNQLL